MDYKITAIVAVSFAIFAGIHSAEPLSFMLIQPEQPAGPGNVVNPPGQHVIPGKAATPNIQRTTPTLQRGGQIQQGKAVQDARTWKNQHENQRIEGKNTWKNWGTITPAGTNPNNYNNKYVYPNNVFTPSNAALRKANPQYNNNNQNLRNWNNWNYYPYGGGGGYYPYNYYGSGYYDNSSLSNDIDNYYDDGSGGNTYYYQGYPQQYQGYPPSQQQPVQAPIQQYNPPIQYGAPPAYSQGQEHGYWYWILQTQDLGGYWLWVVTDAQGNNISDKALYFTDPNSEIVTINIQEPDGSSFPLNIPIQVYSSSSPTILYVPGSNGQENLIGIGSKDRIPTMVPSTSQGHWVWKGNQGGSIGYWQWISS